MTYIQYSKYEMLRLCIQVSMMQMFSPVVNCSDGAGQKKTLKLQITHMMSQQREY